MLHLFGCETLEGRRRLTNTVRMSYFCVIRKGEEEKKKSTRFKEYAYEKNGSPSKKKQSKNRKKEPFVGFIVFVG